MFSLLSGLSALKDVLFDSQITLFWIQTPNRAQAFLPWHFTGWGCHHSMPDYPAFGLQAKPDFPQSCQAGQLPVRLHHHLLCACHLTVHSDTAHTLAPAAAHTDSISLWPALIPWSLGPCLALTWQESFLWVLLPETDVCVPRGSCEPASPSKLSLCAA